MNDQEGSGASSQQVSARPARPRPSANAGHPGSEPRHRSHVLAGAAGLAAIVAVLVMDRILADRSFLAERPPQWTPVYVLRTALIAIGSLALAKSVRTIVDRRLPPQQYDHAGSIGLWSGAGIGMALSVSAAALVLASPERFQAWVEEDGLVEWLSAAMLFVAGALVGLAAVRRLRISGPGHERLAALAVLLVAGLLFLVGLEEVSWFQRVFDIESPEFLEGRNQSELNLHNGATDLAENVYYIGAFVFAVALPSLFAGRRSPGALAAFSGVLPGRIVLFGSIYAGAMVFEMWEVVPIQMVFYFSLYALLTQPGQRWLRPIAALVLIGLVASFLIWGSNMGRSWDDTEVRELVIPFGFLLYGITLLASGRGHD